MDTIEKINAYRDRCRIEHGSVIVSKKSNQFFTLLFIVVGCTKEELEDMVTKQTLSEKIYNKLLTEQHITDEKEVEAIIYNGLLSNYSGYSDYVYKFPLRRLDIKEGKTPQFRLYSRSVEYQKEIMSSINVCPTAELSWKSVIDKVGTSYGLFLKVRIKNKLANGNVI